MTLQSERDCRKRLFQYIEDVFPKLNVRFIAITDNYDNTAGDTIEASMMVPAKNILNDLYARDASRKRRLISERMREEGRPSPSSAPLGYFLEDGKIVPDPDLSPVTMNVFPVRMSREQNCASVN